MIICIGKEDLVGSCPYRISNGDCTADFTIGCSMRVTRPQGNQETEVLTGANTDPQNPSTAEMNKPND